MGVTMFHFFTWNTKFNFQQTQSLYIPYFVIGDQDPDDNRAIGTIQCIILEFQDTLSQ